MAVLKKSLNVRTYEREKLVVVQKYFIASMLSYVWGSNTIHMCIVRHAFYLALFYYVLVKTSKKVSLASYGWTIDNFNFVYYILYLLPSEAVIQGHSWKNLLLKF